jgi:hypothetical protein
MYLASAGAAAAAAAAAVLVLALHCRKSLHQPLGISRSIS